jgi:AcrR family transcriptional regulator
VLEATARLLQTTSLADLSVAQILAAADVGRTSFYENFTSKDDVVVKLMDSLSDEMAAGMAPMFERGERSATSSTPPPATRRCWWPSPRNGPPSPRCARSGFACRAISPSGWRA